MLNIQEETKIAFLSDSKPKELRIDGQYTSLDDINFYCGSYIGNNTHSENVILEVPYGTHRIWWDNSLDLYNSMNDNGTSYRDYVCISFYIKFDNVTTTTSTVGINLMKFNNPEHSTHSNVSQTLTVSEFTGQFKRVDFIFDASDYYGIGVVNLYPTSTRFEGTITIKQVQLDYGNDETLLPREDNTNQADKRFDFDTADMFPLTNENIEFESFSLTESLCSQDNIKFGLCESAHCDFTVVNKPQNFNGQIIRPSISVNRELTDEDIAKINFEYDQSRVYHAGDTFTRTSTRNNTSYLWTSSYLIYTDVSMYSEYFKDKVHTELKVQLNNINLDNTPIYFRFGCVYKCENADDVRVLGNEYYEISDFNTFGAVNISADYEQATNGKILEITRPYFILYDENKNELRVTGTIDYSIKDIQVLAQLINNTYPEYNINDCMVENGTLDDYIQSLKGSIPLGVFRVKDVKTEHTRNMIKKHITAYDDLLSLEQNSADWYTRYMFGVDFSDYTLRNRGFEFARQFYSTYWNFVTSIGLDSHTNYTETLVTHWNHTQASSYVANKYVTWDTDEAVNKVRYYCIPVSNVDPTKRYMVTFGNVNGETDEYILEHIMPSDYRNVYDSLGRGIGTNGSILVEQVLSDNSKIGICCNKNDYFMLKDECVSINIYIPALAVTRDGAISYQLIDDVSLYRIEEPIKLVNGYERLVYYNFSSHEIFACESSITGRDVVRSILEPCGCFFRLSREKGLPEFVYCTRYGLYPSETLYPADDLYPRETVDGELLPLGRYMSLVSNDYRVHNYGRIQILKNDKSSDTKSVCEWEYIGDDKSDNTYIIDDNIFYCNDAMIYDYDNMPEISNMLENMFTAINNMGYVPNQVQAIGMPWVECGDRIGLLTLTSGVDSFIFRRTLSGIQMLVDHYEAVGDEYTEAIKDFGYTIYTE